MMETVKLFLTLVCIACDILQVYSMQSENTTGMYFGADDVIRTTFQDRVCGGRFKCPKEYVNHMLLV